MRKLIILLFLPLFLSACTFTERSLQFKHPASLLYDKDLNKYESLWGSHDAVYLNFERSFEFNQVKSGFSDTLFHHIHQVRYMVLNPGNELFTTFYGVFRKGNEPSEFYIQTINPDGFARKFTLEDCRKERENDIITYKLALPNIVKGTIVDYGYEQNKSILSYMLQFYTEYGMPLQFEIPCERLSIKFSFPSWWKEQTKQIAPYKSIHFDRDDYTEENKITLSYIKENIKAIHKEPLSPFYKEAVKYLQIMLIDKKRDFRIVRGLSSWPEFAKTSATYFNQEMTESEKSFLQKEINKIIRADVSNEAKIKEIVLYVKKNFEPSQNSKQQSFKQIFDKKKATVYDLNRLTHCLFKTAGLTSHYLLVHNAKDGYFDHTYISRRQLYMPAVGVELENRNFFIFPYIKHLPFNDIPYFFLGQEALVLNDIQNDKENGFSKKLFWTLPLEKNSDNTVDENYELSIDEEGGIAVTEEKIFRGASATFLKDFLQKATTTEKEDIMEMLLSYTDGDIEFDTYEIKNKDSVEKPLTIQMKYKIKNLVTITPDEVLFQTAGLFSPATLKTYKIDDTERTMPIRNYVELHYRKNITLNIPDSWTIDTPLEDIDFENRFGKVTGMYTVKQNSIHVAQSFTLKKCDEAPEHIKELYALGGADSPLHIPTIIFKIR